MSKTASQIQGEVHCVEVSRSRPLRAFVRRRMERLIPSLLSSTPPGPLAYRVSFQREGEGHHFICQLDLLIGDQRISATRDGSGLQEALQAVIAAVLSAGQPRYVPALA